MLQINIESRYSIAEKISTSNSLTGRFCISILSPGDPEILGIRTHFTEVLKLRFHDIEAKNDLPKGSRPVLFSRRHLRRLIRFYHRIKRLGAETLTIHCHAGVHRSTAVALILLYLDTGDPHLAKSMLISARAIPLPNRRVIRVFDQAHGTNLMEIVDELYDRFRAYVHDEIQINRDDYLEELEIIE